MAARAKLHFRIVVLHGLVIHTCSLRRAFPRKPTAEVAGCDSGSYPLLCLGLFRSCVGMQAGRQAGRPDAELRVSVTSFLFDARIQPQSFQCWERPANTALQHLSRVFIILGGGGKKRTSRRNSFQAH